MFYFPWVSIVSVSLTAESIVRWACWLGNILNSGTYKKCIIVHCLYTGNSSLITDHIQIWLYKCINVIKWKHFPRYCPFVRGIHWSPVDSPRKDQWRGALIFSLIYGCPNGWVNSIDVSDLRRHRAHYGVTIMATFINLYTVWHYA